MKQVKHRLFRVLPRRVPLRLPAGLRLPLLCALYRTSVPRLYQLSRRSRRERHATKRLGGPPITYELASTFMLYVTGGTKRHRQDSDTPCMSTLITYWSAFVRLIRLRTHTSLPPQLSDNIARFITSEFPKTTPIMPCYCLSPTRWL